MMEDIKVETTLFVSCQAPGGRPMLRVIVCDDDCVLLEKILETVRIIFDQLDIKVKLHAYPDADQISPQILSSADIVLLDIDFPNSKCSGMDIARMLRENRKDSVIIFITNFIEYAPEGYEVQAFRYILKRDLDTELAPYIHQAIEQICTTKETIKIQVNGEIIDLLLDDILFWEVQQHNVTVHVKRDTYGKSIKTYNICTTLSELEQQLDSHGFLRIHKSYLVNMKHLTKFQCREAILDNGIKLRVGEKRYAENKKKYLLWKGWQ